MAHQTNTANMFVLVQNIQYFLWGFCRREGKIRFCEITGVDNVQKFINHTLTSFPRGEKPDPWGRGVGG